MKRFQLGALMFAVALAIGSSASAQTPDAQRKPAKPPPTVPAGSPNYCDVTYSMESETGENDDIGGVVTSLKAVPFADVLHNHELNLQVLDVMSKNQDKGGPYEVTVTEVRACDGGGNVRIASGSLYVAGVTLEGSTKIADIGLDVGKEINDRYKARVKAGAKTGWNHKNAKKVKRNDFGQRVVDLKTQ